MNKHAFDLQLFAAGTVPRASSSQHGLVATRRKLDMADKIYLLDPDAAPLVVVTGRLGKKKAMAPKVEWHTDTLIGLQTAANGAHNNSITTINVDDGSIFTPNDIFLIPATGEYFRVTAVSTNALTVATRPFAGSATAITDDDVVVNLGPAKTESADASQMNQKVEVAQFNYEQVFDTVYGVSGSMAEYIQTYGGGNNDLAYLRMKKGIEHKVKMEMAFWFGERTEGTGETAGPRRTLRGIDKWITTNRTDAGGTLTESELEQFCETAFRYGRKDEKWAFCSARVISVINQFAAGKLQTTSKDKTFGIAVTRYLSGHGALNLVKHHLFDGYYNERMYVLDVEDIEQVVGRDTRINKDVQDNKNDSQQEQWLTEVTLRVGNEERHAALTNVTG